MIVITVTRKPVADTVASNAIKWGTGGINIDASRIGHTEDFSDIKSRAAMKLNTSGKTHDPNAPSVLEAQAKLQSLGRWPANLILSTSTAVELDDQSGITRSAIAKEVKVSQVTGQFIKNATTVPGYNQHGDEGGASRFFKVVKP